MGATSSKAKGSLNLEDITRKIQNGEIKVNKVLDRLDN